MLQDKLTKKYFDSKTQYNNTAVVLQSFDFTDCCEIENEEVKEIYKGLDYMGLNM